MTQLAFCRPFNKADLYDDARPYPLHFGHLLLSDAGALMRSPAVWQVDERALRNRPQVWRIRSARPRDSKWKRAHPAVRHAVTVMQIERWLQGATTSPNERVRKDRLKQLLGR